MFVFISSDANLKYQSESTLLFRKLFYSGIFHERLFTFFDYTIISLCFLMIRNFGFSYREGASGLKFIWFLTLLNILIIFINPNNNPRYSLLGLPILSDVSIYSSLIATFTFFFIRIEGFVYFIKIFGKYVVLFAVLKSIYLFYLWATGSGVHFWGFYSVLMEEDTLLLFAFLQLFTFSLYLVKRESKYLMIWIPLILIEVLSFRRSGMIVSLITILILLFSYFSKVSFGRKFVFTLSFVFLIAMVINSIQFLPETPKVYMARYLGEFIEIPGVPVSLDLTGNKHIAQAAYGVDVGMEILGFWGYGYGHDIEKADISFGSNSAIHNSYVAVWMFHNLFFTLYLLILAAMSVFALIRQYRRKITSIIEVLKFVVAIYLVLFFINGYVLPMANIVEMKMVVFRVLLFAILFRKIDLNQWEYCK